MFLLPIPQRMTEKEGVYEFPYNGKIYIHNSCKREVHEIAWLLKKELYTGAGLDYAIDRGGKSGQSILIKTTTDLKEEAYKLSISHEGVVIEGGSYRGILYGVQTLRQMIQQEGSVLPCLEIFDYPVMENRGYYHDVTRGRIPTLDTLKKLADTLSFYKMNQLQLYIEHSFLFEDFSEMWRDDTPLTAEEIMELDEYCQKLGIELVPSLSSFGHLYKLLNTKTYCHLCELENAKGEPFSFVARQMHHTLDITSEESYELVVRLIEEFMPLFHSKQFNIGADETFDLGKGKSKAYAEEAGLDRIYIDYVKKLCVWLVEKEYRPMFWGDVICGFPEFIKELPKETICLNWGYAWNQSEDQVAALAKAGATQYVCPGVGGWNQFINLMESAYSNISRMCNYGEKYGAIGLLNTDWGDFGHINHPSFSTPGIIYGAAFSWNRQEISFEEINRAISLLEYKDTSMKIMEVLSKIATRFGFGWEHAVRFQEVKTKALKTDLSYIKKQEEQMSKGHFINTLLKQDVRELKQCAKTMDTSRISFLGDCMIAAEGMRIFNEIGEIIVQADFEGKTGFSKQGRKLAEELEHWFHHYKKLWRNISRESELYRISHVIFWYADYLRDLA